MSQPFIPCVGDLVVYYRNGDLDRPIPALVTSVDLGGVTLSLATFPLNAQTAIPRRGVRHVDDPHFIDNPKHRINFGVWDTVEAERKRVQEKRNEKERLRKERMEKIAKSQKSLEKVGKITKDEEIQNQVVKLFEKGKTPKQIAKAIGRVDWTEDRVVDLLLALELIEVPA